MAQVLNADEVDQASQPINNPSDAPGSNPNHAPTDTTLEHPPSAFAKAATSIKQSTLSATQKVSEKTKDRLSMEGQLKQARISLERYVNPKILSKQINEDTRIPKWILKRAKGLVFLTVIKAGFLFAANAGTGCVIIRKPNGGWTGPSSVAVGGISFGFLAGASKVDYIMILPDDKAVKQFTGKGQLRLGGELQLAVGPIGRDGSGSVGAGDKGVSVVYSYSHAQGLYGGLALDGKVISVRPDCNRAFYKGSVNCSDILNGNIESIPSNEDYDMIVHLLDSYCLDDDMTPIKGEKLSIDDLNSPTDESDEKKDESNESGPQQQSMARKVSVGFGKFTSSVSQKWLSLTSNEKGGSDGSEEKVKLQKGNSSEKKGLMSGNNKENAMNNNYSDANYQIGGDDDLQVNIKDDSDDDNL